MTTSKKKKKNKIKKEITQQSRGNVSLNDVLSTLGSNFKPVHKEKVEPLIDEPEEDVVEDPSEKEAYLNSILINPEVTEEQIEQFLKNLGDRTEAFSNFLIMELAAFQAAIDSSLQDVPEMLQVISGGLKPDIDTEFFSKVVTKALNLKFIRFVSSELELKSDDTSRLMTLFAPTGQGVDSNEKILHELSKVLHLLNKK